jgi:hypothetical protein
MSSEDDVKIDRNCESVDWIHLVQNAVKWSSASNAMTKFVLCRGKQFLD